MSSGTKDIRVLTHGHCFDGLVSAALFTAFRKDELGSRAKFRYRSLGYGPKLGVIPEAWLSGDENALLDFKHSSSGKLDWYFDHHKTAFASELDRVRAVAKHGKRHRVYFDATCTSCAKLIARVTSTELGFDVGPWSELIEWADKVDSARFDSAEEAFLAKSPALVLADVVEHHGDTAYLDRTVPLLAERPLVEVASSEETRRLHAPIARAKWRASVDRPDRGGPVSTLTDSGQSRQRSRWATAWALASLTRKSPPLAAPCQSKGRLIWLIAVMEASAAAPACARCAGWCLIR